MVYVVCRTQHFGLVDVVDLERLKNLRLNEMTDASLRHDGDRDSFDDSVDQVGVTHASHSTLRADVGRNALKSHNGNCASVFRDLRLFCVDDVHNDAALEHFSESALNAARARLV